MPNNLTKQLFILISWWFGAREGPSMRASFFFHGHAAQLPIFSLLAVLFCCGLLINVAAPAHGQDLTPEMLEEASRRTGLSKEELVRLYQTEKAGAVNADNAGQPGRTTLEGVDDSGVPTRFQDTSETVRLPFDAALEKEMQDALAEALAADNTVMDLTVPFMVADASPQDQEKQKEKKEKKEKEEQQKAKEGKEKTVNVWTAKKGEEGTIQITIVDKGEKKTIELTAPYVLTIKETPEKTIVVTAPHMELDEGEELTWTIKADELHLSKDAKVIELDKGAVIHVRKHGEEGYDTITLTTKAVKLDESVHAPENIHVHVVTKDGDTKKIVVSPHVEVHADAHAHTGVAVAVQSEISKKQLEEIRESIKKLKEQDLDASGKKKELERIEKVIAQMNKRLEEQHEHDYDYAYKLHTEPVHIEMIHKGEGEEKKDVYFVGKEENYSIGLVNDEGTVTLFIHGDHNEASKDEYEKVVQRLKERLPEGYEVWTEFDEDKDRFSIKIKGGEDMDVSSEVFKELLTALKEELHKIKK